VVNGTNEDHMNETQTQPAPLRFEREGTVIQVGAFDKGERPVMRRPNPDRLIQSGYGYIVMDVPIQGVGIATVQTVAPLDFMRATLGARVRITVEVIP